MTQRLTINVLTIFSSLLVLIFSYPAAATDDIANCAFYRLGECLSCETPQALEIGTPENCLKTCPNRLVKRWGQEITCALKECPKDKPLRDYRGNCYACDSVALPHTFEDCSVCPTYYKDSEGFCRVIEGMPDNTRKARYLKDFKVRETYYTDITCPKVGYFYAQDECFSCDTYKTPNWDCRKFAEQTKAYVSEEDCENRCPNRQVMMDYHSQHAQFSVRKCPPERPVMDARLMCWSCQEKTPIVYDWGGEDNVCPGIRYVDTFSFLCPENKRYLDKEACLQCQGEWKNERCR